MLEQKEVEISEEMISSKEVQAAIEERLKKNLRLGNGEAAKEVFEQKELKKMLDGSGLIPKVKGYPTVLFYNNGKLVGKVTGFGPGSRSNLEKVLTSMSKKSLEPNNHLINLTSSYLSSF